MSGISPVIELVSAYRDGTKNPADELKACLRKIEADGEAPVWISRFDEAQVLAQLEAADRNSPLYGVPFAVKDNIDVAGLPTTAACPDFSYLPARHASVVERLTVAGAIVIGKTNLDQFATGLVGTRTPYGICSSVFDDRYISGGSSSGSAVAVAKGQVPFALGTDTAGSGRVPAAFNALVGLKPTRGLLSTRGVVPACRSLDCVSLFTRSVADAQLLLPLTAAFDAEDPFSRPRSAIGALGDGPPRIGVPRAEDLQFFGDEESAELFAAAIERARTLGAEITPFDLTPFREAAALLYAGPWVAERLLTVAELLERKPEAIHPVVRGIVEGGRRYGADATFRALYRLGELRAEAARALVGLDALLLPTAPTHYTIQEVLDSPLELNSRLGTYTNFVNLLDLSALAVPAGYKRSGMPFGVTFMAPAFHDARLLELGRRFGGETDGAAAPAFGCVWLAVAGAHLAGQPLNHELTSLGARRIRTTKTAPEYRLYALDTTPPKPGLVHAPGEAEHAIEVEVWELTREAFGAFVAKIPAPMTINMTRLADGSLIKGFSCEPYALRGAREISQFGGWRAFRAQV
ncbi:MAG TPA: allophanate hydrolase [Polyangiaceae bacterium]|nr:allophanate hydrolase [Polyangiaceae bacterium]